MVEITVTPGAIFSSFSPRTGGKHLSHMGAQTAEHKYSHHTVILSGQWEGHVAHSQESLLRGHLGNDRHWQEVVSPAEICESVV